MSTEVAAVLRRNNVNVSGSGDRIIVFAHGFGCDQHMWDPVASALENRFRTVKFDYVGHGQSKRAGYSAKRYSELAGYARDVVEIGEALELRNAIFVGHSVSAMIGALATVQAPGMFSDLIMVGPSARYIDDDGYKGGFTREQIEELLDFLDSNHLGWSAAMAPAIMGNLDRPELSNQLENSFCNTDPEIAREFARVTFLSDNRGDLASVNVRTLILQCSSDMIAPQEVGEYIHRVLPNSEFRVLRATGHCPHLSAPDEVASAILEFV